MDSQLTAPLTCRGEVVPVVVGFEVAVPRSMPAGWQGVGRDHQVTPDEKGTTTDGTGLPDEAAARCDP